MNDSTGIHAHRLGAVRDRARELGIDHLVVSSGEDMAYLTGERIDSHERLTALVIPAAGGAPVLVVPSLELTDTVRRAAARVGAGSPCGPSQEKCQYGPAKPRRAVRFVNTAKVCTAPACGK